jgi:glycosyltransferase involved in cell wall biosynthesis
MVLAGYFPYIGGAEGQARAVAGELKRRGINVHVVTRRLPGLAAEETVDGVPVHRLPAGGPGALGALMFMAGLLPDLVLHGAGFDVIHAHLASSHAVAAALAGRLTGKRVIVKLGGGAGMGEVALSRGAFLGRLKLRALGFLDPILAAPNADILAELPGTPLAGLTAVVIPNGVDFRRFAPASRAEKAAARRDLGWEEGFSVLSTSRLANDKGVADLLGDFLRVWTEIARGRPARLYIAGTGPDEDALKELARRLGAPAVFLGPRQDVERLYRAADVFLLPSRSEGMSNSLLEAMASGLPVLATKVSGTEGLVSDNEQALLYAPGDDAGLRAALGRLFTEPALAERLGQSARMRSGQFSLTKTVDKWLALYGNGKL